MSICLKEAFQFQNVLAEIYFDAIRQLSRDSFIMTVTEEHMRKAANPDAENETIDATNSEIPCDVDALISFIQYILAEKTKLSAAIVEAKKAAPIDIDSARALNSDRQQFAKSLTALSRVRSSESECTEMGFKLNATGEQVSYRYRVRTVKTINFDRHKVRKMAGDVNSKAEEVSSKIEKALIATTVEYERPFPATYAWDEALEAWLAAQS